MEPLSVCETKKFYDTEFEATIAAARHNEDMVPYKCRRHWHITHADPTKRIGYGGGGKYGRCRDCNNIFSKEGLLKHDCEAKK